MPDVRVQHQRIIVLLAEAPSADNMICEPAPMFDSGKRFKLCVRQCCCLSGAAGHQPEPDGCKQNWCMLDRRAVSLTNRFGQFVPRVQCRERTGSKHLCSAKVMSMQRDCRLVAPAVKHAFNAFRTHNSPYCNKI